MGIKNPAIQNRETFETWYFWKIGLQMVCVAIVIKDLFVYAQKEVGLQMVQILNGI